MELPQNSHERKLPRLERFLEIMASGGFDLIQKPAPVPETQPAISPEPREHRVVEAIASGGFSLLSTRN